MDPDSEIAYDYPRYRVYKSGRIERLVTETFVPPSLNLENDVVSTDAVYSPEKNTSVRIYLPRKAVVMETGQKKLPLLVYFHGGGFIMESAFSPVYHTFLTSTVSASGCIAVSVDYRRAPENPIPAAYEDSWEAVKWIFTHVAGSGPEAWINEKADFSRVVLAGDSAGANIAHHMLIRAGRENFEISGMALIHPYFLSKVEEEEEAEDAMRYMVGIWEIASLNRGVEDPWINVVGSDLSGLGCGRVLVMVAGNDVLAKEGRGYKVALEKCGWEREVEVVETEGECHLFHLKCPDSDNSRLVLNKFVEFLI